MEHESLSLNWDELHKKFRDEEIARWCAWATNPSTPDNWSFLTDAFPQIEVYSGGGFCPFQVDGLFGQWGFYFRERHDHPTLTLFDPSTDFINSDHRHYIAGIDRDVSVDQSNLVEVMQELIPRLELDVPRWELKVLEVNTLETGKHFAAGWSEAEALQNWEQDILDLKSQTQAYWDDMFGVVSFDPETAEMAEERYNQVQRQSFKILSVDLMGEPSLEDRLALPRIPNKDELGIS